MFDSDLEPGPTNSPQGGTDGMIEPAGLALRLLGEIELVRGGERLPLPASRKARALLAYLAVTGRPHRRERLIALLWDIPDDPRGALRSSLSKLRAIINEPGRQRIVADRDSVRFEGSDVEVDLIAVRRLLAPGSEPASTRELEAAAASFRGEFAEGLALSNSPDFHAWCVAEREEARRLHARLLRMLIERHDRTPEVALPHARKLVSIDPDAVSAHAMLLEILIASGRQREAEEQRGLSLRALAQMSDDAAHELTLKWRAMVRKPASETAGTRPPSDTPEDASAPDPTPQMGAEKAALPPAGVWWDIVREATGEEGRLAEAAKVREAGEPMLESPPGKPSILVLPFTNMSGDSDQDYFSDGITEDIVTDLSQISALSVISRNTAFTFKGQAVDTGRIASKLKVGYVLEGSVRKANGRVRVTAQLIDAATGSHLWAERFDRVFGDIFVLQDGISQSVVAALRVKLLPDELTAITLRPTSNAQAYRYYLEARAKLAVSWSNKEYLRIARRLFAKAIRLDPGYARAYAGIADCDAFAWASGDLDVSYEDMLANSSKALELAPCLAEAHASKGMALYVTGHPEEAIAVLQSAMELDTELFEAHFFYGLSCRDTGDFSSAALHHARAAELQSRNHQPLTMLADVLIAMGRREEGEAAARRCLARIEQAFGRNPEVAEVLAMGATALVCLGENDRAETWVRRAMLLDPESYSVYYNAACTFAVIGNPNVAQKCLEYAFSRMPKARGWLLANAKHDAQLNALRDRPDFQDLMQRLEAHAAAH
jgi:adenylate cyclase